MLLPLAITAAQAPQELTVNNYSEQDITVYYLNKLQRYTEIGTLKSGKIPLDPVAQEVTVHFNRLDYQQNIFIDNTQHPLTISQQSTIHTKRNGQLIAPVICFSAHNPRLSVYEDK